MTPPARIGLLPALTAGVGPAVIGVAALALAGAFSPPEAPLAAKNLPDPAGAEIVVLGNSQAGSAVDAAALREALGLEGAVTRVVLPSSHLPALYGLFQHHVLRADPPPRIVVLPVNLQHALALDPPLPGIQAILDAIGAGDDPVLNAKVYRGRRWPTLERAVATAQAARDAALSWLTSRPAGLLSDTPDAAMAHARNTIFGEANGQNMVLNARAIPVVEASADAEEPGAASFDDSLLPDLLAAAKARGVQVVLATVPERERYYATDPAKLRAFAEWADAHDLPFIDLRAAPVGADGWLDLGHVNLKGRTVYTAQLGKALAAMGAAEGGPLRPLPPPVPPPTITVSGRPAAPAVTAVEPLGDCLVRLHADVPLGLTDAGTYERGLALASPLEVRFRGQPLRGHRPLPRDTSACTGEAYLDRTEIRVALPEAGPVTAADFELVWADLPYPRRLALGPQDDATSPAWFLPPGANLTAAWEHAPELAVGAELRVLAVALGPGGPPTVLSRSTPASGGDAPLVQATGSQGSWGWLHYATLDPQVTADTPWSVTLSNPRNGAPMLIEALVLVHPTREEWLVGTPERAYDVLPVVSALNVKTVGVPPPRRLAADPATQDGQLLFRLSGPEAALTTAALGAAASDGRFGVCLPFHLRAAGGSFVPAAQLEQRVAGIVTVPTPAGPGPWELHTWENRRGCKLHTWTGPGESIVSVPFHPGAVHVPLDVLRVPLAAMPAGADGLVRVQVQADGTTLLDRQLPVAELDGRMHELPLSVPLTTGARKIETTITAPTGTWVLAGLGHLEPATRPDGAWFSQARSPADAVRHEVVSPTPASAAAPPGRLTLAAVLSSGLRGVSTLPRELAATAEGDALLIPAGAEPTLVCLPPHPVTGPVRATATVVATEGAQQALLSLRWVTPTPSQAATSPGVRASPAAPTEVTVAGTPPADATAVRACLRRAGAVGALRVTTWDIEPEPTP